MADVNFKDSDFEAEVLKSEVPVVVDFWAQWCAPCRIVSPIIEELAKDYEGKVKVGKLNVDENPITTKRYSIRGIPAVKLFKNGEVVDEFVGLLPEQAIKDFIDKNL